MSNRGPLLEPKFQRNGRAAFRDCLMCVDEGRPRGVKCKDGGASFWSDGPGNRRCPMHYDRMKYNDEYAGTMPGVMPGTHHYGELVDVTRCKNAPPAKFVTYRQPLKKEE